MAKKKTKKRSKSRSNSIDQTAVASDTNATTTANGANNNDNGNSDLTASPKLKPISNITAQLNKYSLEEEDLSLQRHDEETVLSAIYGDDFTLESGAWNCPLYKLRIRPASDVTDQHLEPHKVPNPHNPIEGQLKSCELTLNIQLNQKYPYSVPLIQITNAVSLSSQQISELLALLQARAKELAQAGVVMGWEMGQVVEGYLVDVVERRKREGKKREEDMKKKVLDFDVDSSRLDSGDEYYSRGDSTMIMSPAPADFDMLDADTQREVSRQREALDTAAQLRKQRRQLARGGILPTIADKHEDDEDDDGSDADDILQLPKGYDLDGDTEQQGGNVFSRYQTDFVEIAHLGSGGGGEVVQAINRLDRRVYAIKKILLESEVDEASNKLAMMQNEKLRREVTTISMMSHKNIVR